MQEKCEKDSKYTVECQKKRQRKQKWKYTLNVYKICDAKYLDTENDTRGCYHTGCHALRETHEKENAKTRNHSTSISKYQKERYIVHALLTGLKE